jgi:glycosyltransferase involved in cell wall biosynthesis
MSRIRLLQVIPSFGCGGAERMVVNLMTHLDRERFEVAAISLAGPEGSALEQKLAENKVRVAYLGKRAGFDMRMPHRIRNVVRKFRPHVVHSHLCLHYVFPSLIGCRDLSHISTVHLPADGLHKWLMRPLAQLAFRQGVIPIAVSREVALWLRHLQVVRDCLVIPNGIPISDYQHPSVSRQVWRKEQGFSKTDVLCVCVARLEKQKNQAMLLSAFARGFRADGRAHLLLVGDGACRQDLEQQVRDLRLRSKVHFLGQRSDVPELLGAADIFILPSENEGNPLSLMEAMAAGLPVIATAVGGVPELIEDHRSGLLVTPGDADGMAVAILRLLQDAEKRRTMAASAAQRAMQAFSASRMAQGYMELYERILPQQMPAANNRRATGRLKNSTAA